MVVAQLALSLVMILGGAAAVVQGFPYVRLESGLAMVIGGATAASAGAILLGLTAILDRLRRVQRAIARLRQEGFREGGVQTPVPAAEPAPWQGAVPEAPDPVALPSSSPARAGAAGLAGLGRAGGRGTEPVFEEPEPVAGSRGEAEPLLPDLLPEAAPRRGRVEDEDLFAAAPAKPPSSAVPAEPEPPAAEAIGLRPSLDEPQAPPAAPQPAPPAADAPEREEERHAVGRYASGANTYVMFSDGSIEAETPRGRFTFGSLDELKSFVNAGGEEARGAA